MKRALIIAAVAIATTLSASTLGAPKTSAPKISSKDLSGIRSQASASAFEVVSQHPELKSLVVRK